MMTPLCKKTLTRRLTCGHKQAIASLSTGDL